MRLAAVFLAGLLLGVRASAGSRPPRAVRAGAGLRPDDLCSSSRRRSRARSLGGRLGYVLDHLDYYRANPASIMDFSQGALGLTLAVPVRDPQRRD